MLLLFHSISRELFLVQKSILSSMVLTCCARSKEPGSAERAERILFNMESLYAEGLSDAVANSRCYSAVITAWARSNSPIAIDRAFALIDRMEQNGKHGSPHGRPNAHCYNACIHAIAKSQHPRKAEKCNEVLTRMTAAVADGFYDSAPSSITYSTIINGECYVLAACWGMFQCAVDQNLTIPFFLHSQHAHTHVETTKRRKKHSTSPVLASRHY